MAKYISLDQLVDDFYAANRDGFLSSVTRSEILLEYKRALAKLSRNVVPYIRTVLLDIVNNLYVELPKDYVDYTKIGAVFEDGYIRTIVVNRKINIASTLLNPTANYPTRDSNIETIPRKILHPADFNQNVFPLHSIFVNYTNPLPTTLYGLPSGEPLHGEFRIDNEFNRIILDLGESSYEKIVLEYISDVRMIDDGDIATNIPVDINLEDALDKYVYYILMRKRRDVPPNEKERAYRDYVVARRRALMINTVHDISEIYNMLIKYQNLGVK